MLEKIKSFWRKLTLAQRFLLASLLILMAGMTGTGRWVAQEIEAGVIHRTSLTTALYVDSFVAPNLQELGQENTITAQHIEVLSQLVHNTPLGKQIVSFKVWKPDGKVLFSTDPSMIGNVFPVRDGLERAITGEVSSKISNLEADENAHDRTNFPQLLETYSPVLLSGTNRIIAVAEFYQEIDDLQKEIASAKRRSWLVVGFAGVGMYSLLAIFFRRASDTIEHQQAELSSQVSQLTEILTKNNELNERVRRAAASVTTLNERFLRRIGSELHDGPAQDLGLALLRLDSVAGRSEVCPIDNGKNRLCGDQIPIIRASLENALGEIRAISAGLGLPHLAQLSLEESLSHAVRAHERRTGSEVALSMDQISKQVPLPVKITIYRIVQEGLNNAFRHAGGAGQKVVARGEGKLLNITIVDQGTGFEVLDIDKWDEGLGLIGMRERIESLGGSFGIESAVGKGTKITASLQLEDG